MNLENEYLTPAFQNELPIQIRPAEQQDYAFILASWSNDAHKIKYDSLFQIPFLSKTKGIYQK